jgi:hypothetical protein
MRDLGQVLTGMLMKIPVFCDVSSCSLVYNSLHSVGLAVSIFNVVKRMYWRWRHKAPSAVKFGTYIQIYRAPCPRSLVFSDDQWIPCNVKNARFLSEGSRFERWTLGSSAGKHFGENYFLKESSQTSCEKWPLASSCPSVRIERLESHRKHLCENWESVFVFI